MPQLLLQLAVLLVPLLLDDVDLVVHRLQLRGDGRHLLQHPALISRRPLTLGSLTLTLLIQLRHLPPQFGGRCHGLGEIGLQPGTLVTLRLPHLGHLDLVADAQQLDGLDARARDEPGGAPECSADDDTDDDNDHQLHAQHLGRSH